MWEKELQAAIEAGLKARIKIMEIYNKGFDVEIKEDDSPVTIADKTADKIIREHLHNAFPAHAFLTEESEDNEERLSNDYVWIVDPVDGTKDFVAKDGGFTTNIALAYKHELVVGVVVVPVTGEIYFEHTWASSKIDRMYMTGTGAAGATVFIHTKTTYPLNYIHIPIMARACFVKGFVYVEAGPQYGFLVGNVKTHTEGSETTKPNTPLVPSQVVKVNEDADAHFKKTYAGWVLGWGGNFGHDRQFSAGVRLGFGLNDLQDPDYKIDGCRVTHTDVQISMRYWF